MARCSHRKLTVNTEADGCSWVQCRCGVTGPRKHSILLAVLAWLVKIGDRHPRMARQPKRQSNRLIRSQS